MEFYSKLVILFIDIPNNVRRNGRWIKCAFGNWEIRIGNHDCCVKPPTGKKNTQTMFWWVQPLFHRHCHNYLCFAIICSFVSISKCYLNSNNSIKAKQNKAKPNKPTGNSDAVWFVLFSTVWLSSRNIFPWCNLDSEAKETLKFVAFLAENIVCLAGPDSYS